MRTVGMFLLIVLDGVMPLVPGEAALLALAPGATAGGWPALLGLAALAATAAFLGDTTAYYLGRRLGTTRFAWQRRPHVAKLLERTAATLEHHGPTLIVTARLVPGVRVAINFMAGATRLSWPRFLTASALGAMLWAAYLLGIGATIGALTGAGPITVVVISMVVMAVLSQAFRLVRRRVRTAWATRSPARRLPSTPGTARQELRHGLDQLGRRELMCH